MYRHYINKINGLIKRLQNLKSFDEKKFHDWIKVLNSLHDIDLALDRFHFWFQDEFDSLIANLSSYYNEEVSKDD